MNHRLAGSLAAAAIALLALGAPVSASVGPVHRVVDDDGKAGLFDNGQPNCSDAFDGTAAPFIGQIFSTIGAAVAASGPGDVIFVCPGTYNESVTVSKLVTIKGPYVGANAIKCAARTSQATVIGAGGGPALSLAADGITVDGMRIANTRGAGIWTSPNFSGYRIKDNVIAGNWIGVDLYSSSILSSTVNRNCFQDNNNGAPGYGIRSTTGPLGAASITQNAFWGHRVGGIVIGGGAPTHDVTVSANWSWDDKSFFNATTVQSLSVASNHVLDTDDISTPGSAIVVGGDSSNVSVTKNVVNTNHTDGVLVSGTAWNVQVNANNIQTVTNGIDITTTAVAGVKAKNNRIEDVEGTLSASSAGILLGATTSGDRLVKNKVLGVADLHCVDLSVGSGTSSTANIWVDDTGLFASPPGICHP